MIEIFFILITWCDPTVPTCLLDRKITEAQVSSWEVCETASMHLPPRIMASIPGALAVGRCEKRKKPEPKEKK